MADPQRKEPGPKARKAAKELHSPSPKAMAYPLPLETQTLYAELVEHLRGADFVRSFADLKGTFTLRERPDGRYWYFRTSEGIGPSVADLFHPRQGTAHRPPDLAPGG